MRKTKDVMFTEGRDAGKVFALTEMPAMQAEAWALRAMGAMVRGGQPIPDEAVTAGFASVALIGLRAILAAPWVEVQPLLEEMMGCIKIRPSNDDFVRALIPEDIEDVATLARLREELFSLHVGFSIADLLLRATSAGTPEETDPTLFDAPTSPASSET